MRNLLILSTLLLSSVATAQSVTATLTSATSQSTVSFGPSDCGGRTVSVTWKVSGTPCSDLSLWLTQPNKECGTAAESGDRALDSIPVATIRSTPGATSTFSFNVTQLPFATTDGGGGCSTLTDEVTFRVCGAVSGQTSIYDPTCSSTATKATPLKVVFDGKAPDAPNIESASGLDGAVIANVSEPADTVSLRLVVSQGGTEVKTVNQDVGLGAIKVTGLQNEVTYQLVAYAIDDAGNVSTASEAKEATPLKTNGFMEEYVGAGGKETGGCGAAGGGVAGGAVLAVLGFWLSSRRNRS
jgi:uncharacterized protein (TIGR03382 family)